MHPIIYLISPPRARSTILFRALQAQLPTLTCFHEPSQAVHDKEKGLTYAADWWREDAFISHSQIQDVILTASRTGPVLVKEMSFACKNGLTPEYLRHPNLYFLFLVRNPLETIASFYQQVEKTLQPDIFTEDIGFRGLFDLYQRVRADCPNSPQIIRNEEFTDPAALFQKVFTTAGLTIQPQLKWEPLSDIATWHEQKKPVLTQYWHGAAIASTQIEFVESTIVTLDDLQQRIHPAHQNLVNEAYASNRSYYDRLLN